MDTRKFDLEDRLIEFSALIIDVIEALPTSRVGNHIAAQLLRSGTAAAPEYGEAQGAESRRDFIHKLKIGLKELRETRVWLKLLKRKVIDQPAGMVDRALPECEELIAIFASSIMTAKKNLEKARRNIQ